MAYVPFNWDRRLAPITQEMLFSHAYVPQVQYTIFVQPVQQADPLADLVSLFVKGLIGYAATEVGKKVFTPARKLRKQSSYRRRKPCRR
jgi:hypothetical protein